MYDEVVYSLVVFSSGWFRNESNLLYSKPGAEPSLSFVDHVLKLVDGRPVLIWSPPGQVRLDLVVGRCPPSMDDRPGGGRSV